MQGMNLSTEAAQTFSTASETYDDYADVQLRAGKQLISKIPQLEVKNILDLGCGTGKCTSLLAKEFPESKIKATDLSENMVKVAKERHSAPNIEYNVKDISETDLNGTEDLIYSNAALQWVPNLDGVLSKWSKQINNNAVMALSLFGPKTFHQLQECLESVFNQKIELPASTFYNADQLQDYANKYFKNVAIDQELITKRFSNVKLLLESIKYTGTRGSGITTNLNWTRQHLHDLQEQFIERYSEVRVSYQIFYIVSK
jgi:malonyl-CoA O-methyltransferase